MILTLAIIAFLLNAVLVGVGFFIAAYLKKKAEHLATREEFQELKTQTAELTRTTKEIEAKISDDVWNRQRRWELKRDLLLQMAKKMREAYEALTWVYATYKTGEVLPEPANSETKLLANKRVSSALTEFDGILSQVALVCNPELTNALLDLGIHMRATYKNTTEDPGEHPKAMPENVEKTIAIHAMIRKELGIDPDRAD